MVYTYIWAHRGASGHEVDNTVEAFDLAIEMGADGIESDAYQTRDGNMVFFHDDTINYRGKDRRLNELTLEQIQSIELQKGYRIPAVKDVFRRYLDKKNQKGDFVRFSLDIKTIGMGDLLVRIADQINMSSRVEITANDNYPNFWGKMKKWRRMSPHIQLVNSAHFNLRALKQIFGKMYDSNWNRYKELGVKAVNIKASYADSVVISQVRNNDLLIYVWDCHEETTLRHFFQSGVDAVYSNYPDLALKVRKEVQGH
jgi:glycerophosphoryl diester phosphodiesterase